MNDPRKPDCPEGDPADRFGEVDDTLQDDAVAQVPAEARGWVAEQRFVHGLCVRCTAWMRHPTRRACAP